MREMLKGKQLSAALCIMLASFSVLMLQISVIRILSVVLWYHWAFLSISLAMLGVGVPGVWFSLRPARPELVTKLLTAAGILVPVAVVAILRLTHLFGEYRALFCVACILPPMLLLGAVVCLLLLEARGRAVSIIYGFDLLGACLGAFLVIPAMHWIPTPQLAAGIGFLALGGAWIRRGAPSNLDMAAAGALVALLVWGQPLEVRYTKMYDEGHLDLLYERWTPTARLTFFEGVFWRGDQKQGFSWGMGTRQPDVKIDQIWMEQDGSAGTPVTRFDGDLSKLEYLFYDVTTAGYQLFDPKRVVIIGGGGGRDILTAKLAGAEHIDAVEINPGVVETISTRFADFSGDVYHLDGVQAHVSEGRSFLRRSDGNYDIIQISLIDSWAATAAGAFSLSENNLYTRQAYELYFDRLSDDGLISTSRWVHATMGLEVARLLALCKSALRAKGIEDPNAHLVLVEASGVGTVLMAKRPFDKERLTRLRQMTFDRGFRLVHPPMPIPRFDIRRLARLGMMTRKQVRGGDEESEKRQLLPRRAGKAPMPEEEPPKEDDGKPSNAKKALVSPLIQWVLEDERKADQRVEIDLSAPTDDRPFFFHLLSVFEPLDEQLANFYGLNGSAVRVLQVLMVTLTLLTLVLFFLPFLLTRWLRRPAGFWQGSVYFGCIGVGFMLIEVPWLQRFILFLEHPSHATTIVLACLLLGAGLGSLWSSRLSVNWLRRWGIVLPVLAALLNVGLPALFQWALPWPFAARVALASVILTPMGVPMGLFFPLGMRRFGDDNKAWFWAVNGAFGVLASVVSLALAMRFGFANVTWIGVGTYLAAWLLLHGEATDEEAAAA